MGKRSGKKTFAVRWAACVCFASTLILPSFVLAATNYVMCLRASNNQYIASESNKKSVNANRGACGPWERHTLIDHNGGQLRSGDTVSIRAWHGLHWSAQPNGTLEANRGHIASWERFRIYSVGVAGIGSGHQVAFLSAHNRWLVAENGGGRHVAVNRTARSTWETFRITLSASMAWRRVAGGLKQVSVGADGTAWGVNTKNEIYRYLGANRWQKIGGNLVHISVGSAAHVWGIGYGHAPFRWTGRGWARVAGGLTKVSVGSDGHVWSVNKNHDIYMYLGGNRWKHIPGKLIQISVGNRHHVWGVNKTHDIYRWNGRGWTHIKGKLKWVSAGADGSVWGVNKNNQIYRYLGGHNWALVAGGLTQISVGFQNYIWGIGHGYAPFHWGPGAPAPRSTYLGVCGESKNTAQVARTAYNKASDKQKYLPGGFRYVKEWNHGSTHAYLATHTVHGQQVCHYSFRGLKSFWKSLAIWGKMGNSTHCKTVHGKDIGTCISEAYKRYSKIRANMQSDALGRRCAGGIRISGHSMGGAMASLFAAELYTANARRFNKNYMKVYTFGAPRIFKSNWANHWNARIAAYRWVYRRKGIEADHVPSYPRSTDGFRHFGAAYRAKTWYVLVKIKIGQKIRGNYWAKEFKSMSQDYAPFSGVLHFHDPKYYTGMLNSCNGV